MIKKEKIISILKDKDFLTRTGSKDHSYFVDEPIEVGGENKAPHPKSYLLGALTSCTAITIRMYSKRKGWDVGEIKVYAELEDEKTSTGYRTKISKTISFGNNLDQTQIKRLLAIGEKCPVARMLRDGVETTFEVVDESKLVVEV